MLIGTRAVMGIGGAFIMPATLSIITNVFTDRAERGKAIGVWAGVSALGIGLGPITGGILLEHFWWGSIFIVNVPIVIIGLVLGYLLVPESKDPAHAALDPVGAVLSIVALGSLLWAVIEAPIHGWGAPADRRRLRRRRRGAGGCSSCGSCARSHPMLDMRFFENPRFSAASGAITLVFLSLFGTLFLTDAVPAVGARLLHGRRRVRCCCPQAAMLMIFAPLSNVWVQRFGNKIVVTAGLLLVATSLVLFAHVHARQQRPARSSRSRMLMGLGMANVIAPCTDSIMGSLPRAKAGVGSAVNDTTRQMGGAVGVAVFGSLMASHFTTAMTEKLARVTCPRPVLAQVKDNVGQAGQRRDGGSRGTAVRRPHHRGGERQLRERPAPRRARRRRHHRARRDRRRGVPPARARDDESENPSEEQEPQPVAVS